MIFWHASPVPIQCHCMSANWCRDAANDETTGGEGSTKTRLSGCPKKSATSKRSRRLVAQLAATTIGKRHNHFLKAHWPPSVEANSTAASTLPCNISWSCTSNRKSRTSSRSRASCCSASKPPHTVRKMIMIQNSHFQFQRASKERFRPLCFP